MKSLREWQFIVLSILAIAKALDYDERKERYSSSVLGLMKLYELEQQYIKTLQVYAVERNNSILTKYLSSIELNNVNKKSYREREEHVSNILNAFTLIRRTHQDWPKWQKFMKTILNASEMVKLNAIVSQAPDKQDMKEMLENMQRAEKINNLHAVDLVQGRLLHKKYEIRLSMRDCVAIGRHKYEIGDYARALMWYDSASKSTKNEFIDILDDPEADLKQLYAETIKGQKTLEAINISSSSSSSSEIDKFDGNLSKEMTSYHLGCRGLFLPPGKLVCRYNFTTSPFLRLAPLKQEEINLDPYIVVYHDVLHDREIAQMKEEMANAHISNAWIEERKANQSQMRQVIGRVSWLTDSSNFMDSVNQRIMDMTGFSMKGIESLQVCNYGPGCNFKPHYDYMAEGYEPPNILTLGDRLASVIFYASEVHLGGATVFPRLDVAITPKKGAGLVWYNTYDDSTHDQRSQHAVCPTLMGSRWTLTKWVHLSPQMFLKPCRPRK